MRKGILKPVSIVLSFAMALSLAAFGPAKVSMAEEDSDTSETTNKIEKTQQEILDELKELVKNNGINYDQLTTEDQVAVVKNEFKSQKDRMMVYAFEAGASKCIVVDIADDLEDEDPPYQALLLKGKTLTPIYEKMDMYSYKKATAVKNFKEAKKVEHSVVVKSYKSKKTTYTTFIFNGTKIKKSTVYSVKGKTYKKGSKKISKKTFNKFLKEYKKNKALKFSAVPEPDGYYDNTGFLYVSKKLMLKKHYRFVDVLVDDSNDAENRYKVMTQSPDRPLRTILGPMVKSPDGKTYQEKDFAKCAEDKMDIPLFLEIECLIEGIDLQEEGAPTLSLYEGEPHVYDKETGSKASTICYGIEHSGSVNYIGVYSDGPYKGKICNYSETWSNGDTIEYCDVYYGTDAYDEFNSASDGLYDPGIIAECYGEIPGDVRTMEVGGDYPFTVKTGKSVELELGESYMSGTYKAIFADGTAHAYDPDDYNCNVEFDRQLNPFTEERDEDDEIWIFVDPTFKKITWTAKK